MNGRVTLFIQDILIYDLYARCPPLASCRPMAQVKRQKVREGRDHEYFHGIERVEYNTAAADGAALAYRHFHSSERVHSRPMEEWMKISVSFTDFRRDGFDTNGKPRPWDDGSNSTENYKRCIKAFFELCSKLGVKYWTTFDTDLLPMSEQWEENKLIWEDVVEYVLELSRKYHVSLLWIAPDLHSHYRYFCGAMTNSDVSTFIQAAAQIKKCLEVAQKFNAECFLLWPHREGYDAIFHTDVARELKLFAKLLKITAEYKEKLNYRCQLLLMPHYRLGRNFNDGQHSEWRENERISIYMWDATSCLYLLRYHNLEQYYKVCSVPGRQLYMTNVYNMLGGVIMTEYVNFNDIRKLTLMMKCIVEQGKVPIGGINLKLSPRRDSSLQGIVILYIKYIDAIAKALRFACNLISEQVFSKHVQHRYSSYSSGIGSRIMNADVTMDELEEHFKKNQHSQSESKSEYLDLIFQRHIDTCDHV